MTTPAPKEAVTMKSDCCGVPPTLQTLLSPQSSTTAYGYCPECNMKCLFEEEESPKSEAFIAAMKPFVEAGGTFEPVLKEAVSEKTLVEIYDEAEEKAAGGLEEKHRTGLEAVAAHALANDPVRKIAANLADKLKLALKALPNPDHDEPRFTGKRWFHASERTEIEQALDRYRKALDESEETERANARKEW